MTLLKSNNNKDFFVRVCSIAIAFWCCIPSLNDILGCIFSKESSIMALMYIVASFVFLLLWLYSLIKFESRMPIFTLVFLFLVSSFYFFTYFLGLSNIEPQYFFCYFITPLLFFTTFMIENLIDVKKIIFWISILPLPAIIFERQIFEVDNRLTISMGTSYNFLTPCLACLVYLTMYLFKERNRRSIFYLPVAIINTFYLIQLLRYGSRGPVICMISFIILVLIIKYDWNKGRIRLSRLKTFVIVGLFVVLIANFWNILNLLSSYLNSNFLSKMIRLYSENNVLNNRDVEFGLAFSGIIEKPIFGHGISSFEYYTGYPYPHNLFLQLLYDGGMVLFFAFMIPMVLLFVQMFKKCKYNDFVLFTYLFSYAVIKSLVSGNIWENNKLWILFALSIAMNFQNSKSTESIQFISDSRGINYANRYFNIS